MNRLGQTLRRAMINSGLVCGSIILTLAVIEVAFSGHDEEFRAWQSGGPFRLNERRIYSLRPNFKRTWRTTEFAESLSSNSVGLRGPELRQGPRTWTRVLILGDSYTYGHGAANHESYPAQLNALFDRDGANVEVVNGGVPGYSTDQQYAYFMQELHVLEPDVLILSLNRGDVGDNISLALFSIINGELVELDAKQNWLYFLSELHQKSPRWLKSSHLYNYLMVKMRGKDLFNQRPDLDRQGLTTWSKEKIFLMLRNLQKRSEKQGFEFLVVTMPHKKTRQAFSFVEPTLKREGIPYLDLTADPIWTQKRSGLWFEIDGHPNVEGYFEIARSVHQFLNQQFDLGTVPNR